MRTISVPYPFVRVTKHVEAERDQLRARIAELERQPIRWRPIAEAPKTAMVKDLLIWSGFHKIGINGGWSGFDWIDSDCCTIIDPTHFAEIVGPGGEVIEVEEREASRE